ncbi:MAG: hypothetical protein MJK04_14350 [Psychrosphaera sp.]|nr:hypothetical protein [Psychrosphaera sp.]
MTPDFIKNSNAETLKSKIDFLSKPALAGDKIDQILESFKQSLPLLQAIGVSVKVIQLDLAAPPQLFATLAADINASDPVVIQKFIDENLDKAILVLILKGFLEIYRLRDKLGNIGLQGIEADLSLTVPPSISVRMLNPD